MLEDDFSDILRKASKGTGLDADALAARSGLPAGHIAGWQKGDGADKAFVELIGSEKLQEEKREKRAEARAKRAAETKKAMEESEAEVQASGGTGPSDEGESKTKDKD